MLRVSLPLKFVFSTVGLLFCAGTSLALDADTLGVEKMLTQFEALGLCAFMVYRNYQDAKEGRVASEIQRRESREMANTQRQELLAVIEKQQAAAERREQRLEELQVSTVTAINKCDRGAKL